MWDSENLSYTAVVERPQTSDDVFITRITAPAAEGVSLRSAPPTLRSSLVIFDLIPTVFCFFLAAVSFRRGVAVRPRPIPLVQPAFKYLRQRGTHTPNISGRTKHA